MRTQYTRVYVDVDTGEVVHVHTQDTPLDFDPVEDLSRNLVHTDMELDLDSDKHVMASDIRAGLEYKNGEVAIMRSAKAAAAAVASAVLYTKDKPRSKVINQVPEIDLFEDESKV